MSDELPEEQYFRIKELCKEGDSLADDSLLSEALRKYEEALELIPTPISRWSATTWVLTAIGDTCFRQKDYQKAVLSLLDVMKCPNALGNPFIHLRLGRAQFELGNEILAKDELARAYMGGGNKIFEGEDPKYFRLVTSSLKPPLEGW
jgi:tetratricopeptide (TPR) repeat protein